jgi:hypothetical protein
MYELSTFMLPSTGLILFMTICVFGVGFLIWFLVALWLEENRMRKGWRWGARKDRTFAAPTLIDSTTMRPNSLRESNRNDKSKLESRAVASQLENSHLEHVPPSPISVFRLSDKKIEKSKMKQRWLLMALFFSLSLRVSAQTGDSADQKDQTRPSTQTSAQESTPAPSSTPPSPLTTPAITGPLQAAPPIEIGGERMNLDLNGVVSGIGLWQSNHVAGDQTGQAALSNGQVFIQKTTGWWQFYIQAGVYNILALGTPFLSTEKALNDLYGPVPVGFLKLVPGKNTSILVGALPTLMGAEYTFDFENMNIERGLLWNQENAVNRGIQVNQTLGKFTASLSWNDGYYSNRYSWLSGSLTYVNGPHSVAFTAMGNLGQTPWQTLATPIQNNGSMYALIYTYTKGNWIVQPYYQYGSVPTNPAVGVLHGASTNGGALLLSRKFRRGFSLAGRGEYLTSTGSTAQNSVNLLYGPGSSAWSVTLTPTYQYDRLFVRGDLSFVRANSITPGSVFGQAGTNPNQPRGVIEVGFLF